MSEHIHEIDPIYHFTEEQALAWINSREEQFYVYILINPLNNLPFYVGKGSGNRCFQHWNQGSHNTYLDRFMNKLYKKTKTINYAFSGFYKSEKRAYSAEAILIHKYGLRKFKTGCLYNLDNGKGNKSLSLKGPDIIRSFKKIHGDTYDYSKVVYKGANSFVEIICTEHGSFFKKPAPHNRGAGCPTCARRVNNKLQSLELNTVLKRFYDAHGARYDYSKVSYISRSTEVTIICKEHGEFKQLPFTHWNGNNCPKCSRTRISVSMIADVEKVITGFKKVHGNRYDYSKVIYINSYTKVEIVCKDHGSFTQKPNNHNRGQGCPKCRVYYHSKGK